MYTTVATRLHVAQPNGTSYSQAVSIDGDNAVTFDATVFNLAISPTKKFTIQVQGSNDLQNWSDVTAVAAEKVELTNSSQPGYYVASTNFTSDVAYEYVRLSYSTDSATSTDYIIVNAGIGHFHD